METVREILAAHGSGISKPGLLAWARLRIDTAMTDAQLDEELAKLGDEVVDVDGFLYLRSMRGPAASSPRPAESSESRWGEPAPEDEGGSAEGEPTLSAEGRWFESGAQAPGDWAPPPPARRGLGGVGKVIGLVFIGFWVLGIIANVAEGLMGEFTGAPTPAPTPTIGSVISYDQIELGDCLVVPTENEFSELRRVPCDTPHGGEVFLVADHPDGAYPSDEAFGEYVATVCPPSFQSWTGSDLDRQDLLDYSWFLPTEESWADGYRTFECYLYLADGALAERSYRGANP